MVRAFVRGCHRRVRVVDTGYDLEAQARVDTFKVKLIFLPQDFFILRA